MSPEVRVALDAHDEEMAQAFEAQAEKERQREAIARGLRSNYAAAERAAAAQAYMLAAKRCRGEIADRAALHGGSLGGVH